MKSKEQIRGLQPIDFDIALEIMGIQKILKHQVRQVRWLYNNSNKCIGVYDEKLVRLIVHRMQSRINELEPTIGFPITIKPVAK